MVHEAHSKMRQPMTPATLQADVIQRRLLGACLQNATMQSIITASRGARIHMPSQRSPHATISVQRRRQQTRRL